MTKLSEIYKCSVCGNVVEVVHASMGELVCCGQKMNLMVENTEEAAEEKHIPVIETKGDKVKVTVGSVPHPMEDKHYIELIQVLQKGKVAASYSLRPGEEPSAEFCLSSTEGISARTLCNLHGLWKSE